MEKTHRNTGKQKGIFSKDKFLYDKANDVFICPAGEELTCRKFKKARNHYEYKAAKKKCRQCNLKPQCTHDKNGRTLKRHIRQDELEIMYKKVYSGQSVDDLRTRQHLMERSFAKSSRYGFKNSRWRGLWRVQIQEYLTASIQNMKVLINNQPYRILAQRKRGEYINFSEIMGRLEGIFQYFYCLINYFIPMEHFGRDNFKLIELQRYKLNFR